MEGNPVIEPAELRQGDRIVLDNDGGYADVIEVISVSEDEVVALLVEDTGFQATTYIPRTLNLEVQRDS